MPSTVSVTRCATYDEGKVDEAVKKALSHLGGIGKYVKKGDRVLLKPNLLSASSPDKAITTHPQILKAMVKQVQSAGGTAIIADSPGGPFNRKMLESCYEKSGWKAVADETGATLNYNTGARQVSYPDGKLLKRIDVMALLGEVDVVITLPKMKTHTLTHITGATKILFGIVPGLIKPAYHLKFSEPERFCDMLLDILAYVKPSLTVMDGIVGIEGDGPGAQGKVKNAGVILASQDSVALDVVACHIMDMRPQDVIILRRAMERGLTSGRLSDIEVVGARVDDVKTRFEPPSGAKGMIGTLLSSKLLKRVMLKMWVPYPQANMNCVRCGICMQNCPAQAITITDRARMDLKKCIRCYCCHELCPHKAVDLKSQADWLKKLTGKR